MNNLLLRPPPENKSNRQTIGSSSIMYSERDEFLLKHEFSTIADIHEIKQEKAIIITGIIKCVSTGLSWYYLACKRCHRKVNTMNMDAGTNIVEHVFKCKSSSSNDKVISVVPRFKIPIRVQDRTGMVSLTLFDRDANKLLQKTAPALLENFNEAGGADDYPPVLNDLLEKKFAFQFKISKYNLDKNVEGYSISNLTDDTEIISELEKKLVQAPEPESLNVIMTDFLSPDSISLKDVVSCTKDNTTPISNALQSSTTSPLPIWKIAKVVSAHSDLKRNLSDVDDVDELATMSSTKFHSVSTGDGFPGKGKGQLLIPKKEK